MIVVIQTVRQIITIIIILPVVSLDLYTTRSTRSLLGSIVLLELMLLCLHVLFIEYTDFLAPGILMTYYGYINSHSQKQLRYYLKQDL